MLTVGSGKKRKDSNWRFRHKRRNKFETKSWTSSHRLAMGFALLGYHSTWFRKPEAVLLKN